MNIALLENLGCSQKLLEENKQKLAALGHNFTVFNKASSLTELIEQVQKVDAIMLANMPFSKEALDAAKNLRFIDVAFTGVDHIPVEAAKNRKIAISNASGYADEAVAELAICFMIQLLRDLDKAQHKARSAQTKAGLRARLLQGKTVGIICCGAIGKRIATLCKTFGAKVIVHNRKPVHDPAIAANVSLDELLRDSDIVSINCPLTPETKGLIGKSELAKMKKTAILINTARGPVVNNKALAEALNNDEIAGAAIDVFDMEPPLPADYPLLGAKNAILTPHLGFYSEESLEVRAKIAFDNLYAWLNGNQINLI